MSAIPTADELLAMAASDAEAGMAANVPYTICFHAQQAAEKYLKAFLAAQNQPIPRTHDILKLIELCSVVDPAFERFRPLAEDLNLFGVEIRYSPSKDEADRRCPKTWSAMLQISEEIRQRLTSNPSGKPNEEA